MEVFKIKNTGSLFILAVLACHAVHSYSNRTTRKFPFKVGKRGFNEKKSISQKYSHTYGSPTGSNRRLAVPKGTTFTLTPSLTVPVLDKEQSVNHFFGFESHLTVQFPLTVSFNDISVGLLGEELLNPASWKKSFWDSSSHAPGANQDYLRGNYLVDNQQNFRFQPHSRKSRDLHTTYGNKTEDETPFQRNKCPLNSLSDRKMVLHKMEMMFSSVFGFDNSRDCLLRAVCEVHETRAVAFQFGLLGEYIISTISVEKLLKNCKEDDPLQKYFAPFAKAEAAGKAGLCKGFTRKCAKSIFTNV